MNLTDSTDSIKSMNSGTPMSGEPSTVPSTSGDGQRVSSIPIQTETTDQGMADRPVIELPTQRTNFQSIVVLALLLLGIGVIYAPRILESNAPAAAIPEGEYAYVVDLDFWRKTEREKAVRAAARFDLDADLAQLPLTAGTWVGQEKPDTNREVEILLEPEQYVRRLYRDSDSGQYMWLSIIGGRSSQPFHAPDICYDADGWQYSMGSRGFELDGGGEIHGLYLDAQKVLTQHDNKIDHHVVSYFYVFPDHDRAISDGIVLFKLTSSRIGTIDESLGYHEDFVRQFFNSSS